MRARALAGFVLIGCTTVACYGSSAPRGAACAPPAEVVVVYGGAPYAYGGVYAGWAFGGWYAADDTWDGATGDDTGDDGAGDDTGDDTGDNGGGDTSGGGDNGGDGTGGGDNGGDDTGGDTSGGGDTGGDGAEAHTIRPASAPRVDGCFACAVECTTSEPEGDRAYATTALSASSERDACRRAQRAVVRWAHGHLHARVTSCRRTGDGSPPPYRPAAPTVGRAAASPSTAQARAPE